MCVSRRSRGGARRASALPPPRRFRVLVLALIQLHSSLAGGNSGQGWMDDVLVPAPPLDPDAALDADAPLDPVARLDP